MTVGWGNAFRYWLNISLSLWPSNWPAWQAMLAGFGLVCFAFFAFLSTAGMTIGGALFLVAALYDPAFRAHVRTDRPTQLWLVLGGYVLFSAVRGSVLFPHTSAEQWQSAFSWLRLLAFLPLAWLLGGSPSKAGNLLFIAVAGWLLGTLTHLNWDLLWNSGFSERTGFKLKIAFSGLLSGIVLLWVGVLWSRHFMSGRHPALTWFKRSVLIMAAPVAILALFVAQSRGAWLAFLLVFPVCIAISVVTSHLRRPTTALLTRLVVMVAIAVPFLFLAYHSLQLRSPAEQQVLARIITHGFKQNLEQASLRVEVTQPPQDDVGWNLLAPLPTTSTGWRYALQSFGLEKWHENLLLGWGPGSTRELIARSGRLDLAQPTVSGEMQWIDHLHNTALEILVQFGIVGAALVVVCLSWSLVALTAAWRAGRVPRDYFIFCVGALAMFVVHSLTDFRVLHPESRALLVMLMGFACSLGMGPNSLPGVVR